AGTNICPQGEGIFAHPPWRGDGVKGGGAAEAVGLGVAWAEFEVRLPEGRVARFESGVGLRTEQAAKSSDGVTFRVSVRAKGAGGEVLRAERHAGGVAPELVGLDLSHFAGQEVTVRLETGPGPAGSVTFDWALWTRPRIVLAGVHTESIEVVSPRGIVATIPDVGGDGLRAEGPNRYRMGVRAPGATFLLFDRPREATLPVDLLWWPFGHTLVLDGGREEAPHGFMQARVQEVTCGGVSKRGIFAHPPPNGRMEIDYVLGLPKGAGRLVGFAGIRDGAECKSMGVGFIVAVNGEERWRRDLLPDGKWVRVEVGLSGYAGKAVVVSLMTDSLGDYTCDWGQWAELRIEAGR
ncbi:MAG: hypothetical protein JXQ73_31625, partial [Phycisphaerae bacterium]|nr:hypothetical protein [Phycisphaerae bacterium]